jgi:hypothetical protein
VTRVTRRAPQSESPDSALLVHYVVYSVLARPYTTGTLCVGASVTQVTRRTPQSESLDSAQKGRPTPPMPRLTESKRPAQTWLPVPAAWVR